VNAAPEFDGSDINSRGPDCDRETVLTSTIASEQDVFALRRHGKSAAEAAGVENQDQVRFATALSELGRDLLRQAPMTAEFSVSVREPATLRVMLRWSDGRVPSAQSLEAAARLLTRVEYAPDGTSGSVMIEHALPRGGEPADRRTVRIRRTLRERATPSQLDDLRAQTHDLIAALEESRAQREDLRRLNQELEETNQGVVALYTELSQELEETNRGVVALYAELDEKSLLLREASESKTRFWSNVSHELRTPINSVVGLARLLLDPGSEPLADEQRRQIALISASGSTLLELVDELLDVAKAEAGRLDPVYAETDLPGLLAQLRGIMLGAAPNPRVRLVMPDPADLSDCPTLVTDEVMLTRILRNLLSNSLKFTDRGEVRLEVRAEASDWLLFTVTDTGVGIAEDQQAKVFEEFYQVAGPHQRDRAGTGLGLPYARRLAELLGGSLTLHSQPELGTSVSLRLPAAAPLPARLPALLSADDDPVFREAFRPVLEQLAERVIEVGQGTLVVESVRRERPDAVLVDLHMPDVDGYTVLAALAADPELRAIPVVVVTSADPSTVAADRLAHARAIASKTGLTARRLAELLAGTRTRDEPPATPETPEPIAPTKLPEPMPTAPPEEVDDERS
jgi:signal transduction histidine kinase